MTVELVPAVWVLFDRYDADAAIAAANGLRRVANDHRCAGRRREADEFDRLADDLERVIAGVQARYRESHPPGERMRLATAANSDEPPKVSGEEQTSTRKLPGGRDAQTDGLS